MSRILRASAAVFLALALLAMGANIALADNLQKADLTAAGNFTVNVGQVAQVRYSLTATSGQGDQQQGCNASDTTPANVTVNAPAGVTVSPNPFTLSKCKVGNVDNGQTVGFSSNVAGNYLITATVTDAGSPDPASYNEQPADFTLHVVAPPPPADEAAPDITVPDDINVEVAHGETGKVVTFTASAYDEEDGDVPVVCVPASGSTFPVGMTTVKCTAQDEAGNKAEKSFTVTITEKPAPPVDHQPVIEASDIGPVEATGPTTPVTFNATASDNEDGDITNDITYSPSGPFAVGVHNVTASVTDSAGHTVSVIFKVTVVDTTAPVIVANDVEKEAEGPLTPVAFDVTATDLVDQDVELSYNVSGPFAVGEHIVTVTATDDYSSSSNATFKVIVKDTTPPSLSPLTDVTIEATSSAGAVVSYFPATAYDLVDGDISNKVIYSHASGSTFPLGTVTVTYDVTDKAGNKSSDSFEVKVVDTTAPTLHLPGTNGVVRVFGWNGFFQPVDNGDVVNKAKAGQSIPMKFNLNSSAAVNFNVTATDTVDASPTISCDHNSGEVFPQGDTTVTCTAKDDFGNTATGSFVVRVAGGNQGLAIFAANYPNFAIGSVPPADAQDSVEEYAASVPGLNYDATANQYIYVWKTDKSWAGKSGTFRLKLADGSVHTAMFTFTK